MPIRIPAHWLDAPHWSTDLKVRARRVLERAGSSAAPMCSNQTDLRLTLADLSYGPDLPERPSPTSTDLVYIQRITRLSVRDARPSGGNPPLRRMDASFLRTCTCVAWLHLTGCHIPERELDDNRLNRARGYHLRTGYSAIWRTDDGP